MQTHLLHIVNDNYISNKWKENSDLAKELLQQRQMVLPLLKNISYESLLKEFNKDKNKLKDFLAFINRGYNEVKKVYNKDYSLQINY